MSDGMKSDISISRFKMSRLMYAMIMASVFMYIGVVVFIENMDISVTRPEQEYGFNTFKLVLYGLSILTYFIIAYVRRYLLRPKEMNGNYDSDKHLARLFFVTIITALLCESVAIYGLFLFFVKRNARDFYIIIAISLMYFIYFFPRYLQWEEWIKKYTALKEPGI